MRGSFYCCPVYRVRKTLDTGNALAVKFMGIGCRDKTATGSKRMSIRASLRRRDTERRSHAFLTQSRDQTCCSSASGAWPWEPRRCLGGAVGPA